MTTIYTAQGKVLKNTATDKWLIKSVTPPTPPVPVFDEVTIGSQTWMSKNLAIDDGGEGIYTQTVNYGQGDVVEYYYTWEAAVRIAASIPGWHLPSLEEFQTLRDFAGGYSLAGTPLKATYGWTVTGSDTYGFTALPAGYYTNSTFGGLTTYTAFWTTHEYSTSDSLVYELTTGSRFSSYYRSKIDGYSIRLIKDAA